MHILGAKCTHSICHGPLQQGVRIDSVNLERHLRLHFWQFLAHFVMSLCNHALSVVCHCRRHWCQHQHLCTALPVTGLIIEASYLTNICSYAPSICTWNIKSMWHIFLNGGHFSKFLYLALLSTWLNLEPSYLAQLCTYTGATHREEIIHLSIIFLKLWIFKKIHILHFLTHWQRCQRY